MQMELQHIADAANRQWNWTKRFMQRPIGVPIFPGAYHDEDEFDATAPEPFPSFVIERAQKVDWDYFPACPGCWRRVYPHRHPIPYRANGFSRYAYSYLLEVGATCAGCGSYTESGLVIPMLFADNPILRPTENAR